MGSGTDTFTLLYVDDDLASRQTLGLMLMRNYPQLRVVSAENGFDALVKMQAHKPEIFIVDLQMPFMDGRGVIEEIKQAEWRHEIIVVSACSDSETIGHFLKSGVSSYVTKPVNFKFLCRNINSVIENMLSGRNRSISSESSTIV
jgi:response regulator RpfG family c-di-GMP phosphodiesterase